MPGRSPYLDDLYIVTTRERARAAFDIVTGEVEAGAGVRSHLGKLRMWSKGGGTRPAGFEDFEGVVWTGDAPSEDRGIKVLGTPLGSEAYVAKFVRERMSDEKRLLDKVVKLDDVHAGCVALIVLLRSSSC